MVGVASSFDACPCIPLMLATSQKSLDLCKVAFSTSPHMGGWVWFKTTLPLTLSQNGRVRGNPPPPISNNCPTVKLHKLIFYFHDNCHDSRHPPSVIFIAKMVGVASSFDACPCIPLMLATSQKSLDLCKVAFSTSLLLRSLAFSALG